MLIDFLNLAQIETETPQIFDLFFLFFWTATLEADRINLEKKSSNCGVVVDSWKLLQTKSYFCRFKIRL